MSIEGEAPRTDLALMDDEQLSEALAAIEAADILSKTRPVVMLDAAAFYAAKIGWPVFPLKPKDKKPLTEHGFKDASRDLEQITAWWTKWPNANIGTPTGADGCGFDVIDIDGIPGFRSLAALKHGDCAPGCSDVTFCPATGELPEVYALAFTPGEKAKDRTPGRHYYIQPTGDGNSTNAAPGLDYRGAGGYVVLPPSMGPDGNRYSWITWPDAA